jgi:hypothetical protein
MSAGMGAEGAIEVVSAARSACGPGAVGHLHQPVFR